MLLNENFQEDLNQIVKPYLKKRKKLSVTIGMIVGDEWKIVDYGKHQIEDTSAEHNIYEIGSISKVFTSLLLADLVRGEKVRLDDPIGTYLPDHVTASHEVLNITLLQLATHSSGLPRLPSNLKVNWRSKPNPYAHYTMELLHEFLANHQLPAEKPYPVLYSNLGAGLLGYILANVVGCSYEEAMRQTICEPLELVNTFIELDQDRQQRLVPGHSSKGKQVPNWDLSILAGAGGIRSSMADMTKFLAANLGHRAERSIIQSMEDCHQPQLRINEQVQVGLGWMISDFNGESLIWHNGATGGYNSFIGFLKEQKKGVCVLTNHSLSRLNARGVVPPPADAIGVEILKRMNNKRK